MSDRSPDHNDAGLVLKLYEMRREEVMRRSRDTISFGFWPTSWDDVAAISDLDHPDNAAWRQVASYWEMVFGFGRRDLIEAEFLVENSGEGLLLFVKVQPFLAQLREGVPTAFQHAEWAATQTETGRQKLASFRVRFGDKLAPLPG